MSAVGKIRLRMVLGAMGVFVPLLLWQLVGSSLAAKLGNPAFRILNCLAILSLALVPGLLTVRSGIPSGDLGFSRQQIGKQILWGVALGLAMGAVLTLLPMALGLKAMVYSGSGYGSWQEALLELGYFLFVVGLTEEFVFRGFFYEELRQLFPSHVMPAVLSSLLFGLAHLRGGFHLLQVFTTGLLGVFFCVCKERAPRRSILSLAIAHGLHDWLIRVLAGLF